MYASLSFWQMSMIGQCVYNNCVLEYHRLTFLNSCESFCKAWFDRSICYSRSYCCNCCPVAQIWPRNQTLKCRKSLASNLFLCCLTWSLTSWWRTSLKSNLQPLQTTVRMTALSQEWSRVTRGVMRSGQSAGEIGAQLAWRTGTESVAGQSERTLGELWEALGCFQLNVRCICSVFVCSTGCFVQGSMQNTVREASVNNHSRRFLPLYHVSGTVWAR